MIGGTKFSGLDKPVVYRDWNDRSKIKRPPAVELATMASQRLSRAAGQVNLQLAARRLSRTTLSHMADTARDAAKLLDEAAAAS